MNAINPIYQERSKYFLITVDVEDWFQVENFKSLIPFHTWDRQEMRVERNIHRLLDLFDSLEPTDTSRGYSKHRMPAAASEGPVRNNSAESYDRKENPTDTLQTDNKRSKTANVNTSQVYATFFVLCWIAERFPHLVREIAARGHEVASHGCYHELPKNMLTHSLRAELSDSRKRLEDTIGLPVVGYRAPSFSVDNNILRDVAEAGYLYDSSYNSFRFHGRYGRVSFNGCSKKGNAYKVLENLYEVPISNFGITHLMRFFSARYRTKVNRANSKEKFSVANSGKGFVFPWGGGCYFRLIPKNLFRAGIEAILNEDGVYVFYIHPWEIDPEQPRVKNATVGHRFRHYVNLQETERKLLEMLERFGYCEYMTCAEYVSKVEYGL
jgi:polysaccharide deacetylase family protein (PEP-CTERM system associated)